jgi:hypothetical protein
MIRDATPNVRFARCRDHVRAVRIALPGVR